jgi:hypothetical protein
MSCAWTRFDEKGKNVAQLLFFFRAIARCIQNAFDFVPAVLLPFAAFFFFAGASSNVTNREADACSHDADGESSANVTR